MNRKLTREEFAKIESLFGKATTAHNKNSAKPSIDELQHLSNRLRYEILGNVHFMLSELISSIISASGQVREKAHWLSVAQQLLYKLENFGVEEGFNREG